MNELKINFEPIIDDVKNDIKTTKFKIMQNANKDLLELYYRIGKRIRS